MHMPKGPEQRLLLIDAGSIVYPAYHVMRELATSSGFPTGAIYGFVRTLLKLLHDYPSEYMAVAFDSKGKTIRHERYEEYKATRPLMDEALAVQIPKIKELLGAWGIPSFAKEGYEADDLIATLAKLAEAKGLPVLIVSGDKDLMQLVGERVRLLKPARPPRQEVELLDRAGVKEHLGVPPELVRDYLALVGDKVDNVPGVPGIGEKTAQKLLLEFGSLEKVLGNAERIGNARVKESLLKHRELALLSRELVSLREVELELGPEEEPLSACRLGKSDETRLRQLLEELEFRSILRELGLAQKAQSEGRYHTILSEAEFAALLRRLASAEEFALDLETTSQDSMVAELVGIALAFEPYEGFYIPVGHDYIGAPKQLERADVLQKLKPSLEDEGKRVLGQNLKYDAKVLRRYGITLRGIAFDSLLAAYLLDPTSRKDLSELAARYLKREVTSYKELSHEDMRKVPIEEATRYAGEDAEIVLRLRDLMVQELKEKGLYQLFTEVELPLIEVLVEMELAGVLMDPRVLEEQAKEIEVLLDNLRKEIYQLAGEEFNPASPKQVAAILYEKLKLPVIKKTKTGPSTDSLVLKELALQHPLPEKILSYRELEKLLNTYIQKLPEYINPKTGRIHTSFNQSVTATGRLSSSDPNLQNIPIRTELGGQIRRAFIAPKGRKLLAADYSQIELRLLAHLSGDENLIRAFREEEDLHTRTAAELFDLPKERVTKAQREIAKRVNYATIYGVSAFRLSKELGIPQKEAQLYLDKYFERYPRVKEFIEEKIKEAEEKGFARTILNRRRYLPHITSRDHNLRSYDQRNAINTPIQGSAADLMKLAMLRVYEKIKSGELKADMLLQIHDELLFELDAAEVERAAPLIKETMEHVMELRVPLKVDIKVGKNWEEI
ncbi:MAG: DNA polymerase I [Candidatus Bipolaricaulia bacterium]